MIYSIPLESLELRYTEQWARWIPKALKEEDVDFHTIQGLSLTDKIESGVVLDSEGTNYWKFSQLMEIMKMIHLGIIKDGDVLLFADLWFPGIEAIRYSADQRRIKIFITGVLHAGTWDKWDFTYLNGMREWGRHLEASWFHIYDAVFVATQFHKDMILEMTPEARWFADRIYVTGLPFDYEEIRTMAGKPKKLDRIVFPHRLNEEKQPHLLNEVTKGLGWEVLRTMDVFTDKKNYYKQLAESKIAISFALQETFGYAMLEALALGCICFVPDRLSYREIFDFFPKWRYKSIKELRKRIENAIYDTERIFGKFEQSIIDSVLERYLPRNVIRSWKRIIGNL